MEEKEIVLMEEREIILKAKKDPQAFDYLYEKYFLQIFRYVMKRLGNRENAEEIVSNVFYKALNKLYLFKWQSVPFSSWLYRIAINELNNFYRVRSRGYKLTQKVKLENQIPEKENNNMSYKFIHKYIKQLPQKDQDLISLRYFEKMEYSQISEIFKKKESTLRVKLHRALKKLENKIPQEVLDDVYQKVS
ncbi:MAG: sigma-70 family RNA polymerase sigma factor [Candidatus Cloacimonadota bacterium]|nr:sigma-70 family RNA polymerase sigma factor [Candidatus Cloacimonadota bacterium]